jgi:Cys-tRNA(Pro)/Cys-tRNA(Cys) deacylase
MTPAINAANKQKIKYRLHHYKHDANTNAYGLDAAEKLGAEYKRVFKTLVVSNPQGDMAVAVVPVSNQLNMKQIAKALGWKSVAMANKVEVCRSTGYVLGGVSPLGQKKKLATVIDIISKDFSTIFVSAGKRGLEIEVNPYDLARLTNADFAEIAQA